MIKEITHNNHSFDLNKIKTVNGLMKEVHKIFPSLGIDAVSLSNANICFFWVINNELNKHILETPGVGYISTSGINKLFNHIEETLNL